MSQQSVTVFITGLPAPDNRLTFAAQGLLIYLFSLPRDGCGRRFVTESQMVHASPKSRDHVRGLLRELESNGVLVRGVDRDSGGRVAGAIWHLRLTSAGTD